MATNFRAYSREEILSGSKTIYIFALSIVFVFLFLAALYESWSVPFSVLLAVPLGAFGAMLFLTFKGSLTNNVYAQIGLITLIGLSAKNAILIVEFAKERVDKGIELEKATLDAVRLRLRPIIMTSLAFILGVAPLLLASGAGAEARKNHWLDRIWRYACGNLDGYFIVPVLFYTITKIAYGKEKLQQLQDNYKEEEDKHNKEEKDKGDKSKSAKDKKATPHIIKPGENDNGDDKPPAPDIIMPGQA